jgi:TolB-like protein
MGEVYRATDTKLGRDVALKVLPAEMASHPERLERFQREAKALAALDHTGIVTVYSVEEAGGVHFLTMQLVDGQPLDRLVPEGGLTTPQMLEIATAIAEALAAAHERGIVHRDLKPANVMVTTDGRVKVLDFGLAKITAPEAPESSDSQLATDVHTREGVVMGTVPYMSPEQVSGLKLDHRSDIFSLGVLLYEMATGRRPFQGRSSAELASSILRDPPPPLEESRSDLPVGLSRLISRCLQKKPDDRFSTARDAAAALRDLRSGPSSLSTALAEPRAATAAAAPSTGSRRRDEGFWVAVLPFTHRGSDPAVEALAEGLSEDILTGLARFSYLQVISHSSALKHASEAVDVRAFGREVGARYVIEGSLRQAGSVLRIAVRLVEATTGAHLWAETYNRAFEADRIFEIQDEVVPCIVSTVADWYGILPRSMSEAVRSRPVEELTPYEALLRAFGYYSRVTPEEHATVRPILERAVEKAPGHATAWAMLSLLYGEEHRFGFNPLPDPLGRSLHAARRAVEAAPESHVCHVALAQAHYFRWELDSFRSAAERALALNPLDGASIEYLAHLLAFAGEWERGCALDERARRLNPHHPAWYWALPLLDAYRSGDYERARAVAPKAVMPGQYYSHALLAALYAQLGERAAAAGHLREGLALRPDLAQIARDQFAKWYPPELVEQLLDGLRKAGLDIAPPAGARLPEAANGGPAAPTASSPPPARDSAAVAIAVLPFSDMSPAKDQAYLCEGMAEEIMNALVRIEGIRVASRASAFRAQREGLDVPAIARVLSVGHILDGSVRTSGSRLRVTAQLTDVATGFHLWSERFDRGAADVFAVQDEIAAGVVEAVRARLGPGRRAVHARPQAANLEAYRAYLTGRHLRHSKNDHHGAMRAYEEAVRLDPSHAPSWVGLAEGAVLAALYGALPTGAGSLKARNALAKAQHLQGESADALAVEGLAGFVERRWRDTESAFRRALELEQDSVHALVPFGQILGVWGAHEEGQAVLARARAADPLAALPCAATGVGLLLDGRRDEAQAFFEQALGFEPENSLALWGSCMALVGLGRFDEGVGVATRAAALTRRAPFFLGLLGWALGSAGRSGEARAALEELRAQPGASRSYVPEAWVLAALGETDAAFARLEQAEADYQAFLYFTGLPAFDPLRADARLAALVGVSRFEEGVALAMRAAALSRRAPFFLGLLGWALGSAGRSGEAWSAIEELRAQPGASRAYVPEAWALATIGDTDAAFARLEQAESEYQAFLHFAGLPAFDMLRADPRFAAMLERLGLPAEFAACPADGGL